MTRFGFLLRSLVHYWRTNLAVLLGVIAGTAVIGGALVVGDSVRESLKRMSLDRLGEIDHALHSHRFVREELADELSRDARFQERFAAVAPALFMTGSLARQADSETRRASRINVLGIDERFWNLTDQPPRSVDFDRRETVSGVDVPREREVVLNRRVADQLQAKVGDEVSLWIEMPASIPRDSLLGKREETSREIVLTVKAMLDEDAGLGRFDLNPSQQLPLNAFVSLETLQAELGLERVRRSREFPQGKPARVNSLFVQAKSPVDRTGETASDAARSLTELLSEKLTPADLSLRLQENADRNYLSLESEQMILEDAFANAGAAAADRLQLSRSPVLVYLANEITKANGEIADFGEAKRKEQPGYAMYSVIAGLDFPEEPPFGPFTFAGDPPPLPLGPDEIVFNDWLAHDLAAAPGDRITVKYHVVGSHGELPEESRDFTLRGIAELEDTPAADRGLTPHLKGITDAETFADWDQPFPMKLDRVTDRDEAYWEEHRATPKAFVSLATAQELWRSRYGQLTSLRVSALPGRSLTETADEFAKALLASLEPERIGLGFQPVKFDGVQAASGTTDFSALFIAFSFFLILSATILIGLLFRLGIERRTAGIGLLSAIGFTPAQVRRMFFVEGLLLVAFGGLLGTAAAVGYASLMVYGLKTWWIGAIGTRFLNVFVFPATLAIGFVISAAIMSVAVWWSLRQLRNLSTRELLSGATQTSLSVEGQRRRGRFALKLAAGCTLAGFALLTGAVTGLIPAEEAFSGLSWQVVAFFLVGITLLIASLSVLSAWLDSDRSAAVRGSGLAGLGRLGLRNAARHRQRSVFTVGLIASATFVIVAVAAGQRNPAAEEPDLHSGNGGFLLVAQTSTPILYDLNTESGRDKFDLRADDFVLDRSRIPKNSGDSSTEQPTRILGNSATSAPDDGAKSIRPEELFDKMHVVAFRVKPGEDASCLNLYQTRLPTILGVPPQMIERGGFKFSGVKADHPWRLLSEPQADGTIPVFGDMNTLMYSLHLGIGGTIPVPDEQNPKHTLKIAGMFDGSVFQGVLLMSEENFLRLFPERAGYEYFLIGDRRYEDDSLRLTADEARQLSSVLETGLSEYGFDAEPVADRLANFLAVQNTYLSTFQTLGGLGLLLGTFGLATVMLRNVLERRAELALLRAVGFQNSSLAWLVLWENALLLLWGLSAGTITALLAMTPHLVSIGADVPWQAAGTILAAVLAVGMAAALFAVCEAVRTPVLATLRSE